MLSQVQVAKLFIADQYRREIFFEQHLMFVFEHLGPFLCLELSRKGHSTSGLRRHLRHVHQIKDFEGKTVKKAKNNQSISSLSPDEKKKLHALALNAIIEDGRSFNDLNKPGILKLFNALKNGKLMGCSFLSSISTSRIQTTSSKHGQTQFKTAESRPQR